MKIIIEADAKEIAHLIKELAEQQDVNVTVCVNNDIEKINQGLGELMMRRFTREC